MHGGHFSPGVGNSSCHRWGEGEEGRSDVMIKQAEDGGKNTQDLGLWRSKATKAISELSTI